MLSFLRAWPRDLVAWVSRWNAVQRTVGLACLIIAALEVWRPCFFLTDDNLSYWLPILTGIGRRTWNGQSIAVEPFLYGGNYNLLREPNALFDWNPLTFVLSPLANTRFYFLMPDCIAIFHLLMGAISFSFLLVSLRRWHDLPLSTNRLVFLSLSFVFSQYALTVGASWVPFLANQSALPLLLLALLHPKRSKGLAFGVVGFLYTLSMGHLSPFLFTLLFFAVFALLWASSTRRIEPVLRFGVALMVACALFSPLLFQAAQGFHSTARDTQMSVVESISLSVHPTTLLASFFGGFIGVLVCARAGVQEITLFPVYASCAGAWSALSTWKARTKAARQLAEPGASDALRGAVALQDAALTMILVTALFIMRPFWLGQALHALPLYRSLRWPFREIFVLLFWAHLWLALRPVQMGRRATWMLGATGVAVFLVSLIGTEIWSFAPMRADRNLVMSGQAQSYWTRIAKRLGPHDQLIAIVDRVVEPTRFDSMPFSLVGAYNYPALFQVHSRSGYSVTGINSAGLDGRKPNHWSGTFSRRDGEALLAKYPHIKALELVSLRPLRIDFREGGRRQHLVLPPVNATFPAR